MLKTAIEAFLEWLAGLLRKNARQAAELERQDELLRSEAKPARREDAQEALDDGTF